MNPPPIWTQFLYCQIAQASGTAEFSVIAQPLLLFQYKIDDLINIPFLRWHSTFSPTVEIGEKLEDRPIAIELLSCEYPN
jgi:hypothetical protein